MCECNWGPVFVGLVSVVSGWRGARWGKRVILVHMRGRGVESLAKPEAVETTLAEWV